MNAGVMPLADWLGQPWFPFLAVLALLPLALQWGTRQFRDPHRALGRLLGLPRRASGSMTLFMRGLFVTGNEFFSRGPENPFSSGSSLTVHRWNNIPETFSAADVRAATEILTSLAGADPRLAVSVRSMETGRTGNAIGEIAIGPHYRTLQILETCEPKVLTYRSSPEGLRSLDSKEVFEAQGGTSIGLIFRGHQPPSPRFFLAITGLGEMGTEAAATFLRTRARLLGRFTGGRPFAAIVAAGGPQGREDLTLRWLRPTPAWWRRLLFRRSWQTLTGTLPG